MHPSKRLPLTLNFRPCVWDIDEPNYRAPTPDFRQLRARVLKRDGFLCQFCGFRSPNICEKSGGQEVHHVNHDHSDNSPENLVTTCPLCHLCQHVGLAGKMHKATLIWLPEISQVALHHLVRSLMLAEDWRQPGADERTTAGTKLIPNAALIEASLFAALKRRRQEAEQYFCTSQPSELARVLLSAPDDLIERLTAGCFRGLRLLPLEAELSISALE